MSFSKRCAAVALIAACGSVASWVSNAESVVEAQARKGRTFQEAFAAIDPAAPDRSVSVAFPLDLSIRATLLL